MTARALVLGLGRFGGGQEAARFLARRGHALAIADDAPAERLRDSVAAMHRVSSEIRWHLGGADASALDGVDLIVVNPGVPDTHPLLAVAAERGVPRTQEVELFLEHFPGRVVLVTGTNGKSTTATLLAAALAGSGIPTLLGGNIGNSLLADEERWSPEQVAVLEISSFQLERIDPRRRRVAGAVMTRITADHLDRHGSLASYHAAKSRAAAMADEFAVRLGDDPVAASFARCGARDVVCRRGLPADGELGRDPEGWLTARFGDAGRILHPQALRLLGGDFQVDNAMLAAAAALCLGADRHRVALAICEQRPLPFRLQSVGLVRGIEVFDNAVSTADSSTISALESLPGPVRWVGGGKPKHPDHGALVAAVIEHAVSAHLFGAAAADVGPALRGRIPVTQHASLHAAMDAAMAASQRGDRILFSPAFASFDQYANFRARGEDFRAWLASSRAATHA